MELKQYIPVLMMIALAILCVGGMFIGSMIMKKVGKRNRAKDTPYECGIVPIQPASGRYNIKFYLAAMLFILFDIEVIFFYPWAISYKSLLKNPDTANYAFFSMAVFTVIFVIAFYYSLKKGVLDFKK